MPSIDLIDCDVESIEGVGLRDDGELLFLVKWESVDRTTIEPYSNLAHISVFKNYVSMQYDAHALEIYSNAEAMKSSLMAEASDVLNTRDLDDILDLIGDFDMDEFLVYTVFLPVFHDNEVFKARHDDMFFRYLLYNLNQMS